MRTAPMQVGRETFSGRNQVSDPLRSEAPPSSKKLPLKTNWRKWQKYQRSYLNGKDHRSSRKRINFSRWLSWSGKGLEIPTRAWCRISGRLAMCEV